MSFTKTLMGVKNAVDKNSDTILTVATLVTLAGAVIASYIGGQKAQKKLEEAEHARTLEIMEAVKRNSVDKTIDIPEPLSKKERAVIIAKEMIPTALTTTVCACCAIGSLNAGKKKYALMASAYQTLEKGYELYRNTNIDVNGEKADTKVVNTIAENSISKLGPADMPIMSTDPNFRMIFREHQTGLLFPATRTIVEHALDDAYNNGCKDSGETLIYDFLSECRINDEAIPESAFDWVWHAEAYSRPKIIFTPAFAADGVTTVTDISYYPEPKRTNLGGR